MNNNQNRRKGRVIKETIVRVYASAAPKSGQKKPKAKVKPPKRVKGVFPEGGFRNNG